MSDYTKSDLRHIAEDLVEDLRECEDGTDITTWELLRTVGYDMDDFDTADLFEIHDALFRAARANHITLDMSSHDGKVEGLPFNLDFIVHNKDAQIKCPFCGSKSTAHIRYGLPTFNEELQKQPDEDKVSLGGCSTMTVPVNGEPVHTDPARICNDCKKKFGTPPLIITKDWSSAEDYRDVVTSIKFSVGGFPRGYKEVTITRNENGALVHVNRHRGDEDKQITVSRWNQILNMLYSQMYLHEWKNRYVNPRVLDGTQWKLTIELTGNRTRDYFGSNDYPPYWSELYDIFLSLYFFIL